MDYRTENGSVIESQGIGKKISFPIPCFGISIFGKFIKQNLFRIPVLLLPILILFVNISVIAETPSQASSVETDKQEETLPTDEKNSSNKSGQNIQQEGTHVGNTTSWNNRATPIMSRLFVWIGFIMSIGLTAKILTAFNDHKIGLMTVIFVGSIGALTSMIFPTFLSSRSNFQPISPIGFILGVLVAFLLLLLYGKLINMFKNENQ